jgi:putative lipoprotein
MQRMLRSLRAISLVMVLAMVAVPSVAGAQAERKRPRDSWLGPDKVKHFFMSAFIQSLTFSGLQLVGASRNVAFAGAIGTTAAFGIGRELHDKRTKGLFSIPDLTWDAAGAAAALPLLLHTQR